MISIDKNGVFMSHFDYNDNNINFDQFKNSNSPWGIFLMGDYYSFSKYGWSRDLISSLVLIIVGIFNASRRNDIIPLDTIS